MKLSKQKQRLFAETEVDLRFGEYTDPDPEDIEEREEQIEDYMDLYKTEDDAAYSIATMMFDGQFQGGSPKDLKKYEKLYGKKIWELAKNKYVLRDHDT